MGNTVDKDTQVKITHSTTSQDIHIITQSHSHIHTQTDKLNHTQDSSQGIIKWKQEIQNLT